MGGYFGQIGSFHNAVVERDIYHNSGTKRGFGEIALREDDIPERGLAKVDFLKVAANKASSVYPAESEVPSGGKRILSKGGLGDGVGEPIEGLGRVGGKGRGEGHRPSVWGP